VIEDGFYWRDPAGYHPEATEVDWRFHPRNDRGQVRMNFGCYLITDGERVVMVDSGIGSGVSGPPGMVAGLMPAAVAELGIATDAVETVVYTHMHYDHIGGSHRDGEILFADARHVFHEREWPHWKTAESDVGHVVRGIMEPLLALGMVTEIDEQMMLFPGVTTRETPGHTPGHLSVVLDWEGGSAVIGGDVSNHPFQVSHPDWGLPVDNDQLAATRTRDRLFKELRDRPALFLAGHYPMPGVGRIGTTDGTRVFAPAQLSRLDQVES
jgi:glyoxylase-like metal-dependent hydrolase (beta-lactamase superfamily II)